MKNKKLLIGVGLLAAAAIGFALYRRRKKTTTPETAPPSNVAVVKPQGNLGADKISQADVDYIRQNAGLPTFTGVDYNDPKNTLEANRAYLQANPDIATSWTDKTSDGSVIGWSHYVIWGNKEGRTWSA